MLIHWQGFFLKSGKIDLLDLFLDVSAISCFRGYYRSRRAASFTRLRPLSIFSDEAIFLASVRLRNYTEAHILQQSSFKKHRATRCSSFNGNRILNKHIDGGKCVNLIFFSYIYLTFDAWISMDFRFYNGLTRHRHFVPNFLFILILYFTEKQNVMDRN